MAEINPVYEGKIVHSGIFDFKDVYKLLFEWFDYYMYTVIEKKYSEKIKGEGKDVDVEWLCLRKISDYFRYRIKVTIRIINLTPVEIMKEGEKVKKEKGEIEIKMGSFLERDYEHKWEVNPVAKFLRGVYDKYVIKTRLESYEDKLAGEVDEVLAQVKSYLAMEGRKR